MSADQDARIAEIERENEQLRTLLNSYNLGGWTDSLSLMKERDVLERKLAEQQAARRRELLNLTREVQQYLNTVNPDADILHLVGFIASRELNANAEELNTLLAKAKEEGRKEAVPGDWQIVPKNPICGKNYDAGLWSRRNYEAWLEDQLTAAPKPQGESE